MGTYGYEDIYDYTGVDPEDRIIANAGKTSISTYYPSSQEEIDKTTTITLIVDGGGQVIPAGHKSYLRIPFDCTITEWSLVADQTGSIVIDVWKDTYANFPPTVEDSITGSEKPTLSSAISNEDIDLTTWSAGVVAGDILSFYVQATPASVTKVTLSLKVIRS